VEFVNSYEVINQIKPLYLSPIVYLPSALGINPIDFKLLTNVNPTLDLVFLFLYWEIFSFTRLIFPRKGLMSTIFLLIGNALALDRVVFFGFILFAVMF